MCNNYRPISILPVFSKIFECIIHKRLYNHFTHQHLLHSSQFGFRSIFFLYKKPIIILFLIWIKVNTRLEYSWTSPRHSMRSVMTFSLRCSWKYLGLVQELLNKEKAICNIQQLQIRCKYSLVQFPQGSVLGLLRFIIFLNDIAYASNVLSSFFLIYADDINVLISHDDIDQLIIIVNNELSNYLLGSKSTNYLLRGHNWMLLAHRL